MKTWTIAALVAAAGCGEDPPERSPGPVAAEAAEDTATPPEPASEDVREDLHVARFEDNVLVECTSFAIAVTPPEPPPDDWPPTDTADRLFQTLDGPTRLRRPCAEQFADRAALGRCATEIRHEREDGLVMTAQIDARFYGAAEALEDDRRMRECLEEGGEWTTVDRDGPEARRARSERLLREAREARERLGR